MLRIWPSAVVIPEERNRCFLYWETTLSTFTTIHGAFVPGRNSKDMNQLAKTHISSLGNLPSTNLVLSDQQLLLHRAQLPPSMASGTPFTPLLHPCCRLAMCGAIQNVSLTTEEKQAKEKEKNRGNQCCHSPEKQTEENCVPSGKKPQDNCPIPSYFQAPGPDTPAPAAPQRTALPVPPAQAGGCKEAPFTLQPSSPQAPASPTSANGGSRRLREDGQACEVPAGRLRWLPAPRHPRAVCACGRTGRRPAGLPRGAGESRGVPALPGRRSREAGSRGQPAPEARRPPEAAVGAGRAAHPASGGKT